MAPALGRRTVAISSAIGLGIAALAVAVIGVPRSEPESWASAWVTSPSSRTLMVRALGQDGIAGGCGPPQVRLTVSESATQVRVAARAVRFHGIGGASCADVGYGPTSHAVSLKSPLGDRPVLDATTGSEKVVLDASTAAAIDGLPSSLVTTDLAMETYDDGVPTLRRTWRSAQDGQFVTLQIATKSGSASGLYGGVTRMVDGVSVQISGHEDDPRDVYSLQWHLPTGRQVNVDLHLAHGVWTSRQALDIVMRTIRGDAYDLDPTYHDPSIVVDLNGS